MLRLTAAFLVIGLLLTIESVFLPQSTASLTRLTNTPEHAVNLNPTLSDDGEVVVFESSADLLGRVKTPRFMRFALDLAEDVPALTASEARVRCLLLCRVTERSLFLRRRKISSGQNADRNSEIFLFDGSNTKQLTDTKPDANTFAAKRWKLSAVSHGRRAHDCLFIQSRLSREES